MKNKRLLIIGGTAFIGRVLVEKLLEKGGYEITLFHRGQTNPGLFPELEHVHGDRNTDDINQLANREWDVVADISGYFPDSLERIVDLLKGKVGRYMFISTVSVFPLNDENHSGAWTEQDTILQCTPEHRIAPGLEAYGEKKAECERILLSRPWLDAIILRPALVFGRYDYTDRLYYWLYKVWKGEPFLLPNNGRDAISYTFVDDLALAIIAALEVPTHSKVYNLSTHPQVSFAEFVNTAADILGRKPLPINVSPIFLEEHKVRPWVDLPLWKDGGGLWVDNQKAVSELGLTPTPVAKALVSKLDWYAKMGFPEPKAGMKRGKELELMGLL